MGADDELYATLVAACRSGAGVDAPAGIPAATRRRALLQPRGPQEPPTGQLNLQGVVIDGDLEPRVATLGVQLLMRECTVDGGIDLLEASLPGLQLHRCVADWIDAATSMITLEVWLQESTFAAGVDFTDARI